MLEGDLSEIQNKADMRGYPILITHDVSLIEGAFGIVCEKCKGLQISTIQVKSYTCKKNPDLSQLQLWSP